MSSTKEEGEEEEANSCLMENEEIFKDLNHFQFSYQELFQILNIVYWLQRFEKEIFKTIKGF
ncbi:hypothetical protein CR513_51217, partial [Mucuna pruriens]